MSGIKMSGLADEIESLMKEYAGNVAEDVKTEAKKAAKKAVKKLKETSPEGPGSKKGHYRDGWVSKVLSENANAVEIVVYNKNKPGLTHLLEKGHTKRGGGRVEGIPHIEPVEQQTIADFEKRVKERLSH